MVTAFVLFALFYAPLPVVPASYHELGSPSYARREAAYAALTYLPWRELARLPLSANAETRLRVSRLRNAALAGYLASLVPYAAGASYNGYPFPWLDALSPRRLGRAAVIAGYLARVRAEPWQHDDTYPVYNSWRQAYGYYLVDQLGLAAAYPWYYEHLVLELRAAARLTRAIWWAADESVGHRRLADMPPWFVP